MPQFFAAGNLELCRCLDADIDGVLINAEYRYLNDFIICIDEDRLIPLFGRSSQYKHAW